MKQFGFNFTKLVLFFIFIFTVLLYIGLGKDYLFEWDEAIYAQLGVELRANKDLITPHWNSELWLEKPPAIAWVTALGQTLNPNIELGSRLLMPFFSSLTLIAIYYIGQFLGGRYVGGSSVAILGFFNLFLSRARVVNTDGMLLATISWLIWLLLRGSSPWKIGFIAALAVFAKGPAGILALLIASPLIFTKTKKYWLSVLGYWLIFISPWHIYQYFANGASFYTPYLLEQVLRRATVPIEFHLESRWFYFTTLYKDLGVGVLLVALVGVMRLISDLISSFKSSKFDQKFYLSLTVLTWIFIPLFIFTLAKTRLTWYILPIYPGLALSIGMALTSFIYNKKSEIIVAILVVGMLFQMVFKTYAYVNPRSQPSMLPDHIKIAKRLNPHPGANIAFLVSSSERVAEAILPKNQAISSSFRYGGAPSVVFYSGKKVAYFYNYNLFTQQLSSDEFSLAVVTRPDQDKIPSGWTLIAETENYLAYQKGSSYANR